MPTTIDLYMVSSMTQKGEALSVSWSRVLSLLAYASGPL